MRSLKKTPSAAAQRIIDAIHAGKLTEGELAMLSALLSAELRRARAEDSLLSLSRELGAAFARLWSLEATHAPKKRGRPRLPEGHFPTLEEKHYRVLKRLVEAKGRGLMARDIKVSGVAGRSLQRVLSFLRDRFLVDLVGKRWHWTPTGERLHTGQ